LAFDDLQKVIKDTFSLEGTPKEAIYLGLAGVIPYLATSLETVYLSYEINRATATGDGLIFSGQTAELMLHMLEPIQVGYGAVVSLNPSGCASSLSDAKRPSRSSLSLELFTGVLNGLDTVESMVTGATLPVSSPLPLPGPPCCSPSNMH
jgi:hypothetical protein